MDNSLAHKKTYNIIALALLFTTLIVLVWLGIADDNALLYYRLYFLNIIIFGLLAAVYRKRERLKDTATVLYNPVISLLLLIVSTVITGLMINTISLHAAGRSIMSIPQAILALTEALIALGILIYVHKALHPLRP